MKWIQRAAANAPHLLQPAALPRLEWVSPLADDGFAEYRDAAFLDRLGLGALSNDLARFWPKRGPQWDGLARFDGGVVLAEAKAHLAELESPPCAAGPASMARIRLAFETVQTDLGIAPSVWHRRYYQYANRLAHLWWLRNRGVNAHLLFIGFLGDAASKGPERPQDWHDAYVRAQDAIGLAHGHALSPWIHHVFPNVAALRDASSDA